MAGFQHVLVPLDGSQVSELALGAAEEATAHHGRLTLMRVVDIIGSHYLPDQEDRIDLDEQQRKPAEAYLNEVKQRLRRTDLQVDIMIASGPPADAILLVCHEEKASAISLCSHTDHKLRQFLLGSTAQRVIKKSPVPVIVVHPSTPD